MLRALVQLIVQLDHRQGDLDRANEALNVREAHVQRLTEQAQLLANDVARLEQENRLKTASLKNAMDDLGNMVKESQMQGRTVAALENRLNAKSDVSDCPACWCRVAPALTQDGVLFSGAGPFAEPAESREGGADGPRARKDGPAGQLPPGLPGERAIQGADVFAFGPRNLNWILIDVLPLMCRSRPRSSTWSAASTVLASLACRCGQLAAIATLPVVADSVVLILRTT